MIDLSRMRGIQVNPDEKTVRVEGGAVWGDVDHATYPFGLAVPAGFVSTTGVGGLALGGGIGYLAPRSVFNPIREFRKPAIDLAGLIPYPALQSMFDALYPAGLQWYWKADFFDRITDDAIALHVKNGKLLPTPQSTMHIHSINGAVKRVGKQDTAWGYRDANFAQVIVGVDPDPANNGKRLFLPPPARYQCRT